MNHITIVTESSANLPLEVVKENNIYILPLRIIWEGKALRDGVDITPQEFYARLRTDNYTPTTSIASPSELLPTFRTLAEEAEAIVAVLLSQDLTGSVQTVRMIQQLEPMLPLHVVDSRTAAMAQGFVALEAARTAAAGATVEQVISRAQEMVNRVQMIATLETLEYLRRGGRIGTAAAFLGSMLQMKPIVGIPPGHGTVIGIARPRTWKPMFRNSPVPRSKSARRIPLVRSLGSTRWATITPFGTASPMILNPNAALIEWTSRTSPSTDSMFTEIDPSSASELNINLPSWRNLGNPVASRYLSRSPFSAL